MIRCASRIRSSAANSPGENITALWRCKSCANDLFSLEVISPYPSFRPFSYGRPPLMSARLGVRYSSTSLKISADRLNSNIHHTAQWGATPDGGVRRLALSPEDVSVRQWFASQAKSLGASVKTDKMGNQFATRSGRNNDIPPIGIGSHLDTQPAGGRYDGILGVLSGIEVLETLRDCGYQTYAPLAVVNWTNEEGARWTTGMLSSAVWAGQTSTRHAHGHKDVDGIRLGDELKTTGFDGETEASHASNPLSAHFEYHIEQGPVLEETGKSIGVVTGVQGMGWHRVTVTGRSQHCGTTPMDRRSDALLSACRMISRVNELALETKGMSTVGVINSEPQSPGTIPGRCTFNVDLCHTDNAEMGKMVGRLNDEFARIAQTQKTDVAIEQTWKSDAVSFDDVCVECVRLASEDAVGKGGYIKMHAGAGHDSVNTSYVCPTAMLFIPSKGGISHHPSEYSSPEECALGAQVLIDAVLKYDKQLEQAYARK